MSRVKLKYMTNTEDKIIIAAQIPRPQKIHYIGQKNVAFQLSF